MNGMIISRFKPSHRKTNFYIWVSKYNIHLINMFLSISEVIHDRYDTNFDKESYVNYIKFCKFIYHRSSTLV